MRRAAPFSWPRPSRSGSSSRCATSRRAASPRFSSFSRSPSSLRGLAHGFRALPGRRHSGGVDGGAGCGLRGLEVAGAQAAMFRALHLPEKYLPAGAWLGGSYILVPADPRFRRIAEARFSAGRFPGLLPLRALPLDAARPGPIARLPDFQTAVPGAARRCRIWRKAAAGSSWGHSEVRRRGLHRDPPDRLRACRPFDAPACGFRSTSSASSSFRLRRVQRHRHRRGRAGGIPGPRELRRAVSQVEHRAILAVLARDALVVDARLRLFPSEGCCAGKAPRVPVFFRCSSARWRPWS